MNGSGPTERLHRPAPGARLAALTALATLLGAAAVASGPAAQDDRRGATPPESKVRPADPRLTHGPFAGHTTATTATVWARLSRDGRYMLTARKVGGAQQASAVAVAAPEHDLCVAWTLTDLTPRTRYRYTIEPLADESASTGTDEFVTAPPDDSQEPVELVFGSCSYEDEGTAAVWRRMRALAPQVVVLLGDTPYIDTTHLLTQRQRYREFLAQPDLRALLRSAAWYATWDDHDFGLNDSNGLLPGKENSRRAFSEFHANPSYGDGKHGVYTRFRRGAVDVFLLDTRYFAATEPSPIDPTQPTLLGRSQWDWLRRELKASDAPFKILACGMIWNGAVRPLKLDHWETYAYERDALFQFIGDNHVAGVVLLGGDIHRSRVIRHASKALAGYDLTELITSPMHHSLIQAANAPHPGLRVDLGEPHAFLRVRVDARREPERLVATFLNAQGRELFELRLDTRQLSAH